MKGKKRLTAFCLAAMLILTSMAGSLSSGTAKVQAQESTAIDGVRTTTGTQETSDGEQSGSGNNDSEQQESTGNGNSSDTTQTTDGSGQNGDGQSGGGSGTSGTGQNGSGTQDGTQDSGGTSGAGQDGTGVQDTDQTENGSDTETSGGGEEPDMSDVTVQGIQIVNADEALVVGFRGEYEAEISLLESVTLQWQMSSDGMTWTDIQGQTERWLTFDVTEEVFSNWYRLTATVDGDGTVYASESVRPVRAVCYIENTGKTRAAGDVDGYDSLADALGQYDGSLSVGGHTVTIVLLRDIQVDETITVGCPQLSYTNNYILKSKDGQHYTVSPAADFTGTMFLEDGEGGATDGYSRVILQNVRIQGYPHGQEVNGTNQVSSLFQLQKDRTFLTIQGNTELLNPGKNLAYLDGSSFDAAAIKIQSSTTDGAEQNGCVGPVNMQGRIAMAGSAAQHIQVLSDTANFTSDSDVVIAPTDTTYVDKTILVS